MRSKTMPDLSNLEREVMLIWANGQTMPEYVRERPARCLKESAGRTVLRRLEDKGCVEHAVDGRTSVYQVAHPGGKVAVNAVQRIIDLFYSGPVDAVPVGMVGSAMLDQRQLCSFADKVAKARGGKR
jgi:BlaI family transcriptional regulator, penicillinase repressor